MKAADKAFQPHTVGKIRYCTYYLEFPRGSREKLQGDDVWCAQLPFVHDLQFWLKQTRWKNNNAICHDLIRRGQTTWLDHNGVRHRIVIEDVKRPRRWGINRHVALPGPGAH